MTAQAKKRQMHAKHNLLVDYKELMVANTKRQRKRNYLNIRLSQHVMKIGVSPKPYMPKNSETLIPATLDAPKRSRGRSRCLPACYSPLRSTESRAPAESRLNSFVNK